MSRVISFCNQKGGVGKTTSCANLGLCLSKKGYKVLCIDFDPQANLTNCLTTEEMIELDKNNHFNTILDLFFTDKPFSKVVIHSKENLDLLPASLALSKFNVYVKDSADDRFKLRGLIKTAKLREKYDYILIDSCPTIDTLVFNVLFASDEIIIPVKISEFSYQGMLSFVSTINAVNNTGITELTIKGFLINQYEPRRTLDKDLEEKINEVAKEAEVPVFKTKIRNLAEIERFNISVSDVNEDFKKFTEEFLSL